MAVTGNKSTYLEEAILNHVLRNTALSSPVTVYLGIFSDTATDEELEAGTLTNEITGYTGNRPAVTFHAPSQVLTKGTVTNDGAVQFVVMPAPAGRQVKYVAVCDAATAGHVLYWAPLTSSKSWNGGDTFEIPDEDLTIDEA